MWYRLNKEADLYEYIGTHPDDLLIFVSPGAPDEVLAELKKVFTIKSEGESSFHLGCDYKKERVNSTVNRVKGLDNLRPALVKEDLLEKTEEEVGMRQLGIWYSPYQMQGEQTENPNG